MSVKQNGSLAMESNERIEKPPISLTKVLNEKMIAMLKANCHTLCMRTLRNHDCESCPTQKLINEAEAH